MVPYIMGKHIKFQYQVKCLCIDLTNSEVLWLNKSHVVEGDIGHLKKHVCQKMVSKKFSKLLWDCGLSYQAGISNRIDHGKMGLIVIDEMTG